MNWTRTRWLRHGSAHLTVTPRVNHGRWIIDCPFCPSAAMWDGGDVFGCALCGNAAAGGRPVPVEAPGDMRLALRLLSARSDIETRNWRPDLETIADLAAENLAHGVG